MICWNVFVLALPFFQFSSHFALIKVKQSPFVEDGDEKEAIGGLLCFDPWWFGRFLIIQNEFSLSSLSSRRDGG